MTTTTGRGPGSRSGPRLAVAGDASGPYASARARLASAGHAVADGFVVRTDGSRADDPAGLDGAGREELAIQLGALELRRGRRLGTAPDALRLEVSQVPRSIEVPILAAVDGPSAAPADPPVATGLHSIEGLVEAIRTAARSSARRAVLVTALPDAATTDLVGTVVTRDPHMGTVETVAHWNEPAAGRARPGLRARLDRVAAAAEAACCDMCRISVAVVAGTPVVATVAPAPRSPVAALRVAVDLRDHGLISSSEALRRVPLALFGTAGADAVSAAASTDASRLLAWADGAPRVPIVAAADATAPVVRGAGDIAALPADGTDVVVAPGSEPGAVGTQLDEIADALDRRGVDRVVLVLTPALRDAATTHLPSLPWRAVVGHERDPAARVLAARLGAAGG